MIDVIDVLNAHFAALGDALGDVDLAGIEDAGLSLLVALEAQDKRLAPIPDTGPDFTNCTCARELADMARQWIDRLDAHLIQHQRAQAALLPLFGAFEAAREAGEAAERIINKLDRQILALEGNH